VVEVTATANWQCRRGWFRLRVVGTLSLCELGERAQDIKITNSLWNESTLFGRKVITIPVTKEDLQKYLVTRTMSSKQQVKKVLKQKQPLPPQLQEEDVLFLLTKQQLLGTLLNFS